MSGRASNHVTAGEARELDALGWKAGERGALVIRPDTEHQYEEDLPIEEEVGDVGHRRSGTER